MIYCLVGENQYLADRETARICSGLVAVRYDGPDLKAEDLPRLLASQTLFDESNLVIIEAASTNKSVWTALDTTLPGLDESTNLLLIEVKPDKRTKTYKWLQKNAKIIDCSALKVSERRAAESWLTAEAKRRHLNISAQLIIDMVGRAVRASQIDENQTIIDQQLLVMALDQLAVAKGDVTGDMVEAILPPSLYENVFDLLSSALNQQPGTVRDMCRRLSSSQDGYKVFGLLASQAVTAAALLTSEGRSSDEVASDIKAHPFAVRQMSSSIRGVDTRLGILMVNKLADGDERLKRGQGDPWQLIEQALLSVAVS